jgi:hypothetical protein
MRVFREPTGEGETADYSLDEVWNEETMNLLAFPEIELSTATLKRLAFKESLHSSTFGAPYK